MAYSVLVVPEVCMDVVTTSRRVFLLLCLLLLAVFTPPLQAAVKVTYNTSPVNIHEDTTAQSALATIACGEATCTCTRDSVTPTSGPFNVWDLNNDGTYEVYFIGTSPGTTLLDYETVSSYVFVTTCTGTNTDTGTLVINVLPNAQPSVTGTPPFTASVANAQSGDAVGTNVYTVAATDAENDPLTFSMTQTPDSGYFSIGSNDGIIRTAVDMRTVTVSQVVCNVTISDGENTVTNNFVTITINNLNTRPEITNLPMTVDLLESQAGGYTLTTLAFTDSTPQAATLNPQCSVSPALESYKFTLVDSNNKLTLNTLSTGQTLLDYEGTQQYLITCTVFDGYLYSVGDVLTLNVLNVNEPPVFSSTVYFCTLTESAKGVSTCTLGVTLTDPEGDTITTVGLLTGNNSERFSYDRNTDRLTFNVDYDVDNTNMPTSAIITMFAMDSNGASGTARIEITIEDANDNTCDFGLGAAAEFTINQGTQPSTLGSFAATDGDLTSPNNKVSYEVVSGLPTSSTNYLTVFGNGEIKYVGIIPDTDHGKSYSLVVRCVDGGTPPLSATATVQVSYLTTTSTTTTTTSTTTTTTTTPTTTTTTTQAPSTSIWDEEAFVIVFSILMALLSLGLLALGWFFCCRGPNAPCGPRACQECCEPRYNRHPQNVRPYNPDDEFFRTSRSRVSPDYKDMSWRNGDRYEQGFGYEGRPVSNSSIFFTGPKAITY